MFNKQTQQIMFNAFAKLSNVNCKHIPRDVECIVLVQAVKWMEVVEELAKHRFLGDPANEKHVIFARKGHTLHIQANTSDAMPKTA